LPVVECVFDTSGYSMDAIQRAAYKFCDRFALEITSDGQVLRCKLDFAPEVTDQSSVVRSFKTEVLDQVLRERIRTETEGVRNVILAVAFSNARLEPQ
jgi:His-Xaa-Ser system protein HxsD